MSSDAKPRVFVTGASGFIGTHIVLQLLEAGYTVVGAARGSKVAPLATVFAAYATFQAVDIPDIASGDLATLLKAHDIGAIIHVAAPLPGHADAETAFRTAVEGSVHVLREGVKAGIKKAVVTSSTGTFDVTNDGPFGPDDFHPITKSAAFTGDIWATYLAQKKFADLAVLEFADSNPEIDITILSPSWVYGPFVPGIEHLVPKPNANSLSSNLYLYALLKTDNTLFATSPGVVDVRDVAKAHVLALTSKSAIGHKRYPVTSGDGGSYSSAVAFISAERPLLRKRLVDERKAPTFVWKQTALDSLEKTRQALADVVGFKVDQYRTWKTTVLDTVDSLVALEDTWREKGYVVEGLMSESSL